MSTTKGGTAVDHPRHYNEHPADIECIEVIEHFNFNLGSAVKYIWRSALKGARKQDLEKAKWYIDREIQRMEKFEHEHPGGPKRRRTDHAS